MGVERRAEPADRLIADLAGRQEGAVGRDQLLALGLGRGAIAHRLAVGRLITVFRGVYAVGHRLLTWRGRCWAAVLAAGSTAALSHRAAAAARELGWFPGPIGIDVSVSVQRRPQSGLNIHRPRSLTPGEITTVHGIPCTTVSRTLADLAAVVDRAQRTRAVRRAERMGSLDVSTLLPRLGHGHPGAATLRGLLADYEEDVITRSELEPRFLELVAGAQLPVPAVNTVICGREVDFLWRAQGLVVETDGYANHRGRDAFETDRARATPTCRQPACASSA